MKRKPYITKVVNEFYNELKSVENDPEQVLFKCYVFYKTYEYEPDVIHNLSYSESKTILPADLYTKMTGNELHGPICLLFWVYYHCNDFVSVYESKFPKNKIDIEHKTEPGRVYIVVGSIGEYSMHEEQAIAVFKSKRTAIAFVKKLNNKPTSYYDVHFSEYTIGDESNMYFYIKSAEIFD